MLSEKIEVWHFTTLRDPPSPRLGKRPHFFRVFFCAPFPYQIGEESDNLSNQSRIQNCNTRAVLHFSRSSNAYLAETCLSNTNFAFTCLANAYIYLYANVQKYLSFAQTLDMDDQGSTEAANCCCNLLCRLPSCTIAILKCNS